MSRTLTDADRERLHQLARRAFEDGTKVDVDPDTLLALVTDAPMQDGQLARLRERWTAHANQYDPYPDPGMPVYAQDHYAAGVARCADELQRWLGGDTTVFDAPMPPYEEPDDDVDENLAGEDDDDD